MSAHIPRKVFAKSLVLVDSSSAVALMVAALPIVVACAHDDAHEMSHNPPMPTETASPSASASSTVGLPINMNPPPPSATVQPTSAVTESAWTVTMNGGKCESDMNIECPPGDSCNPPPPEAYPCPAGIAQNSYPLKLSPIAGTSQCTATYTLYSNSKCPPNVHCNPPPPQQKTMNVPCPK